MNEKGEFRLVIAGSRDFNNYALLKRICDYQLQNIKKEYEIIIISGTARGADKLGELYAKERGYKIEKYPADWDRYGKSAGYRRNSEMGNIANAVIVFWDGISKGTKHMIDIAEEKKLLLYICRFKNSKGA